MGHKVPLYFVVPDPKTGKQQYYGPCATPPLESIPESQPSAQPVQKTEEAADKKSVAETATTSAPKPVVSTTTGVTVAKIDENDNTNSNKQPVVVTTTTTYEEPRM